MSDSTNADLRARRTLASVLLGVLAVLAGCNMYPATVHPDFASLRPARVRVSTENRTIYDLHRYATSGIIQSLIDRGEVNVLGAIERATVERLGGLGYAVAGADGPADGELRVVIRRWNDRAGPVGRSIELELDVDLVRTDDGQSLYQRRFPYTIDNRRSGGGPLTVVDVERGAAAAVRVALREIPPAGAGAGRDTGASAPASGRSPGS